MAQTLVVNCKFEWMVRSGSDQPRLIYLGIIFKLFKPGDLWLWLHMCNQLAMGGQPNPTMWKAFLYFWLLVRQFQLVPVTTLAHVNYIEKKIYDFSFSLHENSTCQPCQPYKRWLIVSKLYLAAKAIWDLRLGGLWHNATHPSYPCERNAVYRSHSIIHGRRSKPFFL